MAASVSCSAFLGCAARRAALSLSSAGADQSRQAPAADCGAAAAAAPAPSKLRPSADAAASAAVVPASLAELEVLLRIAAAEQAAEQRGVVGAVAGTDLERFGAPPASRASGACAVLAGLRVGVRRQRTRACAG